MGCLLGQKMKVERYLAKEEPVLKYVRGGKCYIHFSNLKTHLLDHEPEIHHAADGGPMLVLVNMSPSDVISNI